MSETRGLPTEMDGSVALQVLDDFLLDYHIGHVAFLLFVLTVPLGLVKGSRKLLGLIFVAFGGLFLALPSIESETGVIFALLGVGLMVAGPILFATSTR